jgi:hypothetical protein
MKQLTKEQARRWIGDRAKDRKPLPDPKELRRQLGLDLIQAERNKRQKY